MEHKSKMEKCLKRVAHMLEVVISVIVLVAVVIGIFFLYDPFKDMVIGRGNTESFLDFMGAVLIIAIGIEFFKVLYRPNVERLLEIVIFVMARHMIVTELTAVEELVTVLGIVIATAAKYWIFELPRRKSREQAEKQQAELDKAEQERLRKDKQAEEQFEREQFEKEQSEEDHFEKALLSKNRD